MKNYNIFSSYNFIILGIIIVIFGIFAYTYLNLHEIKAMFISAYAWLNKQNPMIAGAVSLWALGSVTYLAKNVPKNIWDWTIKQTTVTMTLNNMDDVYSHFLNWYHVTGRSNTARTLLAKNSKIWLDNVGCHEVGISAGYGVHYFIFGGKIFQFSRVEKEASQTIATKETITLKTIGRTQAQFHQLMEEIKPEPITKDVTSVYRWAGGVDGFWREYSQQSVRKFSSVILPEETQDTIVHHISTFNSNRDWYIDNGIPYRTGLIIHGIPGTGKSSLVRALCEKFQKSLYVVNLSTVTDDSLEQALNMLPSNVFVLMEDVDTYSVTNSRSKPSSTTQNDTSMDMGDFNPLTLSGLLNALDGIISSDGRIVIATTNHLEKLDPALVRKGRFNLSVELGHMTQPCISQFIKRFFPNFKAPHSNYRNNIVPVDLQAIVVDNLDNPDYVFDWCVNIPKINELKKPEVLNLEQISSTTAA